MKKIIIAACFSVVGLVSFFAIKQNDSVETSRKISSTALSFEDIKDEATAIQMVNADIISITDKEEVNLKIDRLQKLSASNPSWQVINLYAAATLPLKKLEGIFWRLRPIVKKCGVCHISAVSAIRKGYYNKYLTGPHLGALLDYIAEPTTAFKAFESISELQDFAVNELAVDLEGSSDGSVKGLLAKVNDVIANTKPGYFMEFDARLGTGHSDSKNFISEKKRFSIVTQGNLYSLVSSIEGALASIHFFRNYDMNDGVSFANSMIRKTALNNIIGKTPEDVTPIETLAILDKRKFRKFGKARTDGDYTEASIQANLDKAFSYYHSNVKHRLVALENSMNEVDSKNDSDYLMSSKLLSLNYDGNVSKLKEKLRILENAKAGKATVVSSPKTGEEFQINPKAIFTYRADLKNFLPHRKFKETNRKGSKRFKNAKGKNEKLTYWNYKYGLPTSWKDPEFGGLLPGANNDNLYEIMRRIKLTPATEAMAALIPVP